MRIIDATRFAIKSHDGQKRKITGDPYIQHPMMVSLILATHGVSEDLIIAGLLHDVIEDCGVKHHQLVGMFGQEVADLVADVTEPPKAQMKWKDRKEAAIESIARYSPDAVMLKSADVLSNVSDILKHIDEAKEVFSPQWKVKTVRVIDALIRQSPKNPLNKDLTAIKNRLETELVY